MDIANIVSDEQLYELKLKNPLTGEDTGVTFWVEPFALTTEVDTWSTSSYMMRQISKEKDGGAIDADDVAEIERGANIRKCIKAVRKWDFGGKAFGRLGIDPKFTPDNVKAVFNDPKSGWIVDQVCEVAKNVKNFFPPSEVNASNTSGDLQNTTPKTTQD